MVEPTWATELLLKVCEDEGRSLRRRPKVNWGVSKVSKESSGRFNPRTNTIRVVVGVAGDDHKQVFLHEICHWLTQPRGSKRRIYFYGERRKKHLWHGKRFYLKLHELLERYGCLTEEYRKREGGYMKRSVNYL